MILYVAVILFGLLVKTMHCGLPFTYLVETGDHEPSYWIVTCISFTVNLYTLLSFNLTSITREVTRKETVE